MSLEPNPYVGYPKDRRSVLGLWERFNLGQLEAEACTPYHRLLMADWQRCSALGIDAAMRQGRRLPAADYSRRRDAQRRLLDVALPILRDVGHFLVGVPGILILTEATGTVLHISGDASVQDRAATLSGIVEGSQWNEATAGTNGVGTALSRCQPVHVYASEHYCEGWHDWSCAAAPILDREGRQLLGVVDFTTVETDFRDQALGLSVSLANSISARLSLEHELERRRVLMSFSEAARHYPHDDLIALDRHGQPIAATPNERCRQLVERWQPAGAAAPEVQHTTVVRLPDGDDAIGRVLVLARPAGWQRVFQREAAPAAAAAADAAPEASEPPRRFGDFVTRDAQTRALLSDLERIATADVNLLLVGETGTGKELIARQLHALSPRSREPYLAVNCGAISEPLMESTFFGYVRGAYSGADPRGRAGVFESAGAGTLFLDEVGELPLSMQAALLRVLEDGSYQRVGSCRTQRAECRIVAATHRDLERLIADGRFREDLYFRLKVVQRRIRPLRERACDIVLLAERYGEQFGAKHGRAPVRCTPQALALLRRHAWPGNARELRNAIEAAVLCGDGLIDVTSLPPELRAASAAADAAAEGAVPRRRATDVAPSAAAHTTPDVAPRTAAQSAPRDPAAGYAAVRACERDVIVGLLRRHRHVREVAAALDMARSTLYRKFGELGISPAEWVGRDLGRSEASGSASERC